MSDDGTPPPTKYFPQNFSIKPKSANVVKSKIIEVDPVFYYPQTTVPEREMTFNKEPFPRPGIYPGRYNPHDVTCRCHLKATGQKSSAKCKRCPGKIDGEGHTHVFDSNVLRLVHPSNTTSIDVRRRRSAVRSMPTTAIVKVRAEREPISFRVRSSIDVHDDDQDVSHEVRYNTMVRKRSLFSLKTGNPVAFLSAQPRFEETTEKPIKLYEKKRMPSLQLPSWSSTSISDEKNKKSSNRMTQQRLEELAKPRNALPKRTKERVQVYTKLPQPTTAILIQEDENTPGILDVDNIHCGFSDVDVVKLRAVNEEKNEKDENAKVISDK